MSTSDPRPPTEEELRAAYDAEIRQIRVEHVVLEHVVTLVNLGMRRTGLMAGTESERDLEQVRVAIEAVRALLPVVESVAAEQAAPIREALSQLQLAFVRGGGSAAPDSAAEAPDAPAAPAEAASSGASPGQGSAPPGSSSGTGPAQRSGRLWVPGQ